MVHLLRLANDETYKRYRQVMGKLRDPAPGGPAHRLIDVLFGRATPHVAPAKPSKGAALYSFTAFNAGLNSSQLEAIDFALAASDLALIHGPPGTGKTTTVVEFIQQVTIV
jgi:Cdc6-like AAA superfamily ATPase